MPDGADGIIALLTRCRSIVAVQGVTWERELQRNCFACVARAHSCPSGFDPRLTSHDRLATGPFVLFPEHFVGAVAGQRRGFLRQSRFFGMADEVPFRLARQFTQAKIRAIGTSARRRLQMERCRRDRSGMVVPFCFLLCNAICTTTDVT